MSCAGIYASFISAQANGPVMNDAAFWGSLLLAAAPPVVLFCTIIAKKSFLILLSLARYIHTLLTQSD